MLKWELGLELEDLSYFHHYIQLLVEWLHLKNALLCWSEGVPLRRIQKLEGVDVMQELSIYSHTHSV